MIDRKQLINSVPTPTNKDVIIYNVELKELIDENVIENYYQLLPSFLSKKEDYLLLKKQRDEMANSLNKIYLFNNSWSEEDYLIIFPLQLLVLFFIHTEHISVSNIFFIFFLLFFFIVSKICSFFNIKFKIFLK